jgi:hypothetical protein
MLPTRNVCQRRPRIVWASGGSVTAWQPCEGQWICRSCPSQNGARSAFLSTLPAEVKGICSTKVTDRGAPVARPNGCSGLRRCGNSPWSVRCSLRCKPAVRCHRVWRWAPPASPDGAQPARADPARLARDQRQHGRRVTAPQQFSCGRWICRRVHHDRDRLGIGKDVLLLRGGVDGIDTDGPAAK